MLKEKVKIFLRFRPTLSGESQKCVVKPINQNTLKVHRGLGKYNLKFDHVLG